MIRDALGREFDFREPPRRVVSLVPSLTETLFAIGAGDSVAGITDFCIFPEGLDRPRFGGTKNPAVARLRELEPDLVYVNLEENLKTHADRIASFAPVFATEPKSVADVATLIRTLGAIHDREPVAERIAGEVESAVKPVASFSFLVAIWKNPWMWCGGDTYVSDLVTASGGRNLLGHQKRYPTMDLDCALALQPDVIFLPDEPYVFTADDAAAIEGPRVIGPFPGHLFTWHGVRTIEGLRFLSSQFAANGS
jgi:ABC-type Fe3+-hydroxamate transport system substrate-binding protein